MAEYHVTKDDFLKMQIPQIAEIVKIRGTRTCLLGLNGTTRWFLLENPVPNDEKSYFQQYAQATANRLAEVCALLFDFGIETLVIPLLNESLFQSRGDDYKKAMLLALELVGSGALSDLYQSHNVQMRLYGNYEQVLQAIGRVIPQKITDAITPAPLRDGKRVLWGVCAASGIEEAISLSIAYYEKHNIQPKPQDLIREYYGGDISPIDFYITSGKIRLFDAPFLWDGKSDIYSTNSPSLYLTASVLRNILYDHLFERKVSTNDKQTSFTKTDILSLREFYLDGKNQNRVLGVGATNNHWGIWMPE